MKSALHGVLGAIAFVCISTFWIATAVSELFMDHAAVAAVKNAVLTGMWVLIPAMMATGGSGFALSRARSGRLVAIKQRRMKAAAANGLLILMPAAVVLASWANAGRFDAWFYTLQAVELLAGAVNFGLLALNMRDGFKLSRRLLKHAATG